MCIYNIVTVAYVRPSLMDLGFFLWNLFASAFIVMGSFAIWSNLVLGVTIFAWFFALHTAVQVAYCAYIEVSRTRSVHAVSVMFAILSIYLTVTLFLLAGMLRDERDAQRLNVHSHPRRAHNHRHHHIPGPDPASSQDDPQCCRSGSAHRSVAGAGTDDDLELVYVSMGDRGTAQSPFPPPYTGAADVSDDRATTTGAASAPAAPSPPAPAVPANLPHSRPVSLPRRGNTIAPVASSLDVKQ
ncbi:hypothetical protein BC831DRAFT_513898 [Entophlyctis helioformis]|nr:hypothetical protein BC831DRAFT_513898 [Entophlyctis helioformis]